MRTMPAIIAACVAVLCIVCAALFSPGTSSAGEERARSLPLLAQRIDVADVSRITLERPDTPTLVFTRSDDGQQWNQTEPFDHPMQAFSIRQLAVLAASVEYAGTIDLAGDEESLDAATLGLTPARGSVTFEHEDGSTVSLTLGRRGIAGRAYVQVDDDPLVYVVDQSMHDRALGMNPLEWRQRTIFHDVSIDADAIAWARGSQTSVQLEREGRQWNLTLPVQTRTDDVSLEDYISSLARAEHAGFMADEPTDLTRFGLANPALSLTISTSRKTVTGDANQTLADELVEQTLLVGSRIGGSSQDRFGMVIGTPVVVRLPLPVLQSLFRDPRLLADTKASGMNPADVKTIRITGPEGEFRLQRDLEKWIALDHGDVEVPAGRVDELLRQLTELRAPSLGFEQYPMDQHVANVIFTTFSGKHDTVRIAYDPAQGQWKLENGDGVLRVHTEALQPPITPKDFGLGAGG